MRKRDFLCGCAFIYGAVGIVCLIAVALVRIYGHDEVQHQAEKEIEENASTADIENKNENEIDMETGGNTDIEYESDIKKTEEDESLEALAGVDTESASKIVYLTFDDGPSYLTAEVLDVLDEYGVKATFFVTYQPDYEEMYAEIVKGGHAIGVHSYSHVYSEIYATFDAWLADFEAMYSFIYEATGVYPTVYRFPGGSMGTPATNHPDVLDAATAYLNSIGVEYFDWNVSGVDGGSASVYEIYASVVNDIQERNHPVILMHDGVEKENSLAALPDILKQLLEWGYSFETLNADVPPIQQGISWDY